jgi:hypothetical protein
MRLAAIAHPALLRARRHSSRASAFRSTLLAAFARASATPSLACETADVADHRSDDRIQLAHQFEGQVPVGFGRTKGGSPPVCGRTPSASGSAATSPARCGSRAISRGSSDEMITMALAERRVWDSMATTLAIFWSERNRQRRRRAHGTSLTPRFLRADRVEKGGRCTSAFSLKKLTNVNDFAFIEGMQSALAIVQVHCIRVRPVPGSTRAPATPVPHARFNQARYLLPGLRS